MVPTIIRICSNFFVKCNFYFFLWFQNIWSLSHFRRNYYLQLNSGDEIWKHTRFSPMWFLYQLSYYGYCVFFMVFMFSSNKLTTQQTRNWCVPLNSNHCRLFINTCTWVLDGGGLLVWRQSQIKFKQHGILWNSSVVSEPSRTLFPPEWIGQTVRTTTHLQSPECVKR